MSKYNSIKIGDKSEFYHKILEEEVHKFAEISGDNNKLHVDKSYAENTSFKKPVVHGMLGAAFVSKLIGTKLPGDGALWFSQNFDFLIPLRINDTILVKGEIIKKNDRLQSVEIKIEVINQHQQLAISGIGKVKIVNQETNEEKPNNNNNRTFLIFGSTGGIGSSLAKILAKKNYNLILHFHSNDTKIKNMQSELSKISSGKILIVKGNIENEKDILEIKSRINREFDNLTGFVNCATHRVYQKSFKNLEWNDIKLSLDNHLKSSFILLKTIIPMMKTNDYGKIVLLSSQYVDQQVNDLSHYITSKAALSAFVKSISKEVASDGIRINLVSPSMTNTQLNADVPEKTKLVTIAKTPLGKLAEPNDVAATIKFLLSEDSDFLTGETIRVNGGQLMI